MDLQPAGLSPPAAERGEAAPGERLAGPSRGEIFAGLCVLGFANGTIARASSAVAEHGTAGALLNTLGISALVWAAFFVCPALMLQGPRESPTRGDLVVGACALAAFMLPASWPSWVALTGLALHLLRDRLGLRGPRPLSPVHRGAWVLLATTGAMFWGRVLLHLAGDLVLGADAVLVAWLARSPRFGNTVQLADGTGHIWIAPACSSVANVSLAVLCWVLFAQLRGLRWSAANAGWCLLACLAVVGINVARIGLVVLNRDHYDLVHGTVGAAVAGALTAAATVAICAYGVRRGRLAQG